MCLWAGVCIVYVLTQLRSFARFSPGSLPQWAKRKVTETSLSPTNERTVDFPKGRWAQRVDSSGMTVKSIYDRDSVIPFPGQGEYRTRQCDTVVPDPTV